MLKIYNTLLRKKENFTPINPNEVKMYVCGITVYDYCHLGHARLLVVFDVIARWLRQQGYPLTYIKNITDIDDKIIARAQENNESIENLTKRFISAMRQDAKALGVLPPDQEPKATDYIPAMISMIQKLIKNNKAYVASNGDVYYAVRQFTQYGQLSGKSPDDLRAGERVEINTDKKDPLDFVLWKKTKNNEPYWESPWGKGRPGWHIECSAMSQVIFGETFDIHGGGADLQFPHHENELAQNCGINHSFAIETDEPKPIKSHVRYWIHNGFVRVNNEKMSKSLGNFFTIREVLEQYHPEVIRFFLLKTHYRSPLNYTETHLDEAKSALTRLYTTLKNFSADDITIQYDDNQYTKRFFDAMNDDFGTTEAVAVLFELSTEINKNKNKKLSNYLKALANILGLLELDVMEFLQGSSETSVLSNDEINKLIEKRKIARLEKNWAESDRIRDLFKENHIILEDSPEGTSWRRE